MWCAFNLRSRCWRLRASVAGLAATVSLAGAAWSNPALIELGDQARNAGRLAEAAGHYEAAASHFRSSAGERAPETLAALSRLTLAYGDLGRHTEQLALAEQVLKTYHEVSGPRHPDTLTAMHNLALAYRSLGRVDQQLELTEKVLQLRLEIQSERDPHTLLAMANLALAYSAVGRHREAVALNQNRLRLSTEVLGAQHFDTLGAMNNLASAYGAMGRSAERLALNEKLLGLASEILGARHPNTLVVMNNLALTYGTLGRLDEQLALTERALALRTEVLGPRHQDTLSTMNNLALALAAKDRFAEAQALDRQVLQIRTEVLGPRHPDTLASRSNLEHSGYKLEQFAEQVPHNERTLKLRTEVLGARHSDTLFSMSNLAYGLGKLGRHEEELTLNQEALRLRTEVLGDNHPETLVSIRNSAQALLSLERPREAAALSSRYVAGAEWQRSQPGLSSETRRSLFEGYAQRYRFFSTVHARVGELAEGLRLVELGKARTLLETMAAQRAGRAGVLPAAELERLDDLNRQVGALDQAVARARNAAARQNLEASRNQLARGFEALQAELKARFPKYAQLSDVRIVGAAELPGLVPESAVAVNYVVTDTELGAYLVDSNGALHWQSLGSARHLADAVDIWRRAHFSARQTGGPLPEGGPRAFRLAGGGYRLLDAAAPAPADATPLRDTAEVGRWLARVLLEPLAPWLQGQRRWIVSPDGPLAQLPFEALPFGEAALPAVAAAEIHYTQSLSVYALSRQLQAQYRSLEGRRDLFAMGNAQYEDRRTLDTNRAAAVEGTRERLRGTRLRDASQLPALDGLWPDLPGTEAEVQAVARLFPGSASVHLGEMATEQRLQALNASGDLRHYRYLLLSAHGYLSPEQPALSSIVLGLQQRTAEADGYVTAAEWPSYDLKSELAVLSACDSGVGKVVSGEGVMGLPFAMFVAGNVNTVLSLWPVEDRAAADFVTAFFLKVRAGLNATQALATTKREFSRHRRWNHPSYWAPFILVGAG